MVIFGDKRSGNCLKVKYTADHLGQPYDWRDIDIMAGESRTADYLGMNPQGQVPCIKLHDGQVIAQSNAIIRYLAHGSALLPSDRLAQARVDEWLFWEQYSHEPYVAVCRFQMVYEGKSADQRDPERVRRGELALDHMECVLADQTWLAGEAVSIADIALLAYTRIAPEGGFDLVRRPALTRWIARCEEGLGIR
ncbi:MAG: glutathione S-transferase family protein [Pseudomonadota bacterium]